MTSEVIVINKIGVALATDSAVTISGKSNPKIFNNSDKLFELDCDHPIGIMINGNMEFLGIPWEILIKDFRSSNSSKGNLKEDLKEFISYLEKHSIMRGTAEQEFIHRIIGEYLASLSEAISRSRAALAPGSEFGVEDVEEILHDFFHTLEKLDIFDSLSEISSSDILLVYGKYISVVVDQFVKRYVGEANGLIEDKLRKLITLFLGRAGHSLHTSGLVVAGYAKDDLFPSVAIAEIEGALLDKVRVKYVEHVELDRAGLSGRVISFAHTDVTDRLLSGADHRFIIETADFFASKIKEAADGIPLIIGDAALARKTQNQIVEMGKALSSEYINVSSKNIKMTIQREFDEIVSTMPKQDIIELAEALVSITAIERKASADQPTVGGPVDVALITKHAGFVWIKRKRYFDLDLNPRYAARKFGTPRGPAPQDNNAAASDTA